LDLFLVVDDSSSIGHGPIQEVREFLSQLVSSLDISRDMTHIGFLQFSDRKNTGIRFNLDNNYDATTISNKFKNMPWHAGRRTLTHLALDIVAQKVRIYV
jgi:hypothetical protein